MHQHYSNRPQVGKRFHVRGTNSVAVYFTLTKSDDTNRFGYYHQSHVEALVCSLASSGPKPPPLQ
jgi:hypothetical protein